MSLDLDALERDAMKTCEGVPAMSRPELAALVRIARAAVAWRDCDYDIDGIDRENVLCDALREAGL